MSDHTIVVIWVIKTFLYSSVYSCPLFLIFSASVRSILFLSFIVHVFEWNVPLVSLIFLKGSLLLFSSISLHCSLEKAFLSLLALLWKSAFRWIYLSFSPLPLLLFFSQLFENSSVNHFAFLHFFFLGWFWSVPVVQCYESPSIVLQDMIITLIYWCGWKWKSLSRVWLFATPWSVQSMELSRPEYWSG